MSREGWRRGFIPGWDGGLDGSQRRQFGRGWCEGNLGAAGFGDVAAHRSLFCSPTRPPPPPPHTHWSCLCFWFSWQLPEATTLMFEGSFTVTVLSRSGDTAAMLPFVLAGALEPP